MYPLVRCFLVCACLLGATFSNAAVRKYTATLDGSSEAPPNASTGSGLALFEYDDLTHMLLINLSFNDLLGTTTAAHIHAATALAFQGTASVATQTPSFTGFPLGVHSGVYVHSFDLSSLLSYRAGFVTANGGTAAGAEAALLTAMSDGKAYLNIHTDQFPGGEIRGFLVEQPVPEVSSTLVLSATMLLALCLMAGVVRSHSLVRIRA